MLLSVLSLSVFSLSVKSTGSGACDVSGLECKLGYTSENSLLVVEGLPGDRLTMNRRRVDCCR